MSTNLYNNDLYKKSDSGNVYSKIGYPIFIFGDDIEENEIWLEGAVVSRQTYSKLFAVYGVKWGAGDGSTTFKLPDARNRALWGSGDLGYIEAGLPNITGYFNSTGSYDTECVSGAFYKHSKLNDYGGFSSSYGQGRIGINASRSNALYGKSTTVQPNAIKVRVKTRYK